VRALRTLSDSGDVGDWIAADVQLLEAALPPHPSNSEAAAVPPAVSPTVEREAIGILREVAKHQWVDHYCPICRRMEGDQHSNCLMGLVTEYLSDYAKRTALLTAVSPGEKS
jgi:hypothetical protein